MKNYCLYTWGRCGGVRKTADSGRLCDFTASVVAPRGVRTVGHVRLGAVALDIGQPVALGRVTELASAEHRAAIQRTTKMCTDILHDALVTMRQVTVKHIFVY